MKKSNKNYQYLEGDVILRVKDVEFEWELSEDNIHQMSLAESLDSINTALNNLGARIEKLEKELQNK